MLDAVDLGRGREQDAALKRLRTAAQTDSPLRVITRENRNPTFDSPPRHREDFPYAPFALYRAVCDGTGDMRFNLLQFPGRLIPYAQYRER